MVLNVVTNGRRIALSENHFVEKGKERRSSNVVRILSVHNDDDHVARFEASLKAATHVAILILVVFCFTSTGAAAAIRGYRSPRGFVAVLISNVPVLTAISTDG